MTRVHWTHICKLPVLLEPLKYSLHRWVFGDSTTQRLHSHAILIATVTASLPEDQSARLFVNKADCFLLPGWTDPSQLLLDPCHSADKKIHITGREDLLSANTATTQTTQLPGEGRKRNKKLHLSRPDWLSSFFHATLCFTLIHTAVIVVPWATPTESTGSLYRSHGLHQVCTLSQRPQNLKVQPWGESVHLLDLSWQDSLPCSFFIPLTTTLITFHVYNKVQHQECFHTGTIWKCIFLFCICPVCHVRSIETNSYCRNIREATQCRQDDRLLSIESLSICLHFRPKFYEREI